MGAAFIKYIEETALPNDTSVSATDATNWGIDEALIKSIRVQTTSTDWGLSISTKSSFTVSIYNNSIFLALHVSGDQNILLDLPYIDEDSGSAVHLFFHDYVGSAGATGEVFGQKASTA